MTEQEKSREEIYKKYRGEMSEDLMSSMPIELKGMAFGDEVWLANKIIRMAYSMIDKGYRKEEEVRKETAKEIKETLLFELEENGSVDFTNAIRDENFKVVFNRVFEKFGVEVED